MRFITLAMVAILGLACHAQDRILISWTNPPTLSSGTYNTISVSATIVGGNRGIDAGGNVERILSVDMRANGELMQTEADPGEDPPPLGLGLPVVYSSLHWAHNVSVSFSTKVTWKLVDGTIGDATLVGPSSTTYNRSVVYGISIGSEGTADIASLLGRNQDLASQIDNNWTEAQFLSALAGRTMSSITAHGGIYSSSGEGFQKPPNPTDDPPHINAEDISPTVQDTVENGYPPMHFSLLVGCDAGASSVYAMSWLSGSQSTTNRAVIGFKLSVFGYQADGWLKFFQAYVATGSTCYKAAYDAWVLMFGDSTPNESEFKQDIAYRGDEAARIQYAYDGQSQAVHQNWCRKGA